jgi:hypothetical protein
VELRLITTDLEGMIHNFVTTFLFESEYSSVDQALQIMRHKVFEATSSLPMEKEEDEWISPLQKLQSCYNINVDDDDNPKKVNITEIEGQRDVEGPRVELQFIGQSIKIKIKQLRIVLGHTGYYRKFIKGYAQITTLIEKLLKKDYQFI